MTPSSLLPLALTLPLLAACSVRADAPPPLALPANYNPMVSLAPLAKAVEPAVVNVYVSATRPTNVPPAMQGLLNLPSQREVQGQGSGFVVSTDGFIVTNNHVVEDASEIKVKFANGEEYTAKVVGSDPASDVALVKVEGKKPFTALRLGDSDEAEVGDWVVAVGNPLGLGHTVTAGIISGKGRFIPDLPLDDFIQTDASINPGNSGGPLIGTDGVVLGMNTAIVRGANTVAFAIPADHIAEIITQLRTKGKVEHGFMGIGMAELEADSLRQLGVAGGVWVRTVQPGGPAEGAGLRPGDLILKIEGKEVDSSQDVYRAVASQAPGTKVKVTVRRGEKEQDLSVTLGARPESASN